MPSRGRERLNPGEEFVWGVRAAINVPESIAATVARQIALMSVLDDTRNGLVAALLNADYRVVAYMLSNIDAPRQRHNAIHEAGKVLNYEDRHLWGRVMGRIRDVERQRNELAHGIWGYAKETRPKSLLIIDAKDFLPHRSAIQEVQHGIIPFPKPWAKPPDVTEFDTRKIEVLGEDYLEDEVSDALQAGLLATLLREYLRGGPQAAERRARLCREIQSPPLTEPHTPIETSLEFPPGWHL